MEKRCPSTSYNLPPVSPFVLPSGNPRWWIDESLCHVLSHFLFLILPCERRDERERTYSEKTRDGEVKRQWVKGTAVSQVSLPSCHLQSIPSLSPINYFWRSYPMASLLSLYHYVGWQVMAKEWDVDLPHFSIVCASGNGHELTRWAAP